MEALAVFVEAARAGFGMVQREALSHGLLSSQARSSAIWLGVSFFLGGI